MFCPQCGSNQSDEMKFCRACGANLQAVLQVITQHKSEDKSDWSKTHYFADRTASYLKNFNSEELVESESDLTPEMKRYSDLKNGVITSFVGLGSMIFLFVLMQGIILSGQAEAGDAEILSRLWVAGVVPFLIGVALIINGLFVAPKVLKLNQSTSLGNADELDKPNESSLLQSAQTNEFTPISVTEQTTRQLANQVAGRDSGASNSTNTII